MSLSQMIKDKTFFFKALSLDIPFLRCYMFRDSWIAEKSVNLQNSKERALINSFNEGKRLKWKKISQ
jgi:hypothetical protein